MERYPLLGDDRGKRIRRLMAIMLSLALLGISAGAVVARPGTSSSHATADECVTFAETGHSVCGRFLSYWQTYGGLAIFGYPLTGEVVQDGQTIQYFERARFEWHPGAWPERWDVLLGRLGAEQLAGGTNTLADILDTLRIAVDLVTDVQVAQSAGWNLVDGLDHCFDNPGVGGMGVHYINVDLLDTSLDPLKPEALVYQHGPDGELSLGAVEWIVPADAWDAEGHDGLPELLGHELHLNEALGVYILHAWIFKENPAGMFEDWNPNVTCPA